MIAILLAKFPLLAHFAAAAKPAPCTLNGGDFLGLPHWWQYLSGVPDGAGGCSPAVNSPSDILPIVLAVINILLHLAGFVAVIAVIYSGVSYILAIGNPEKITSSRKGIQNALIGLALVMIAAQIVAFIGKVLYVNKLTFFIWH